MSLTHIFNTSLASMTMGGWISFRSSAVFDPSAVSEDCGVGVGYRAPPRPPPHLTLSLSPCYYPHVHLALPSDMRTDSRL